MSETATVTASGGTQDLDVSNVQDSRTITVHISGDANATDLDLVLLGTTNSSQTPHPVLDPTISDAGGKKQVQGIDASSEDQTAVYLHAKGLVQAAVRVINNGGSDSEVTASVEGSD